MTTKTTETLLTDDEIWALIQAHKDMPVESIDVVRAIEQAVLQSPEVQRWRLDSARLAYWKAWWMRSEDDDGQLPPDVEKHLENLDFDDAFDAAMEQQK